MTANAATPPNAIVFKSGHATRPQMMPAGAPMNLIGVIAIAAVLVLGVPA